MASDLPPLSRKSVSFWDGFVFYLRATFWNRLTTYFFWSYRRKNKATAPARILTYPTRPDLNIRFFPPSTALAAQNEGTKPAKAPIFFLIHGGGWVIGNPGMDDEQAHMLSTKHGFCVMSLDYHLAPKHRFPRAIYDLSASIESVLDDAALIKQYNLDRTKVALGGFSAGGVMTLGLAQLPSVRDRIHALVSFYPLTDFTGESRGPASTSAWGKVDHLPALQPMYDWAYVPAGQNLRDPLLSPLFATREQIPHPLFVITAEKDSLCKEGWMLARGLAGLGTEAGLDVTESWERNGVRYDCAAEMVHCFTHFWETIKTSDEWETKRKQTNDRIWGEVIEWTRGVLSSHN